MAINFNGNTNIQSARYGNTELTTIKYENTTVWTRTPQTHTYTLKSSSSNHYIILQTDGSGYIPGDIYNIMLPDGKDFYDIYVGDHTYEFPQRWTINPNYYIQHSDGYDGSGSDSNYQMTYMKDWLLDGVMFIAPQYGTFQNYRRGVNDEILEKYNFNLKGFRFTYNGSTYISSWTPIT